MRWKSASAYLDERLHTAEQSATGIARDLADVPDARTAIARRQPRSMRRARRN